MSSQVNKNNLQQNQGNSLIQSVTLEYQERKDQFQSQVVKSISKVNGGTSSKLKATKNQVIDYVKTNLSQQNPEIKIIKKYINSQENVAKRLNQIKKQVLVKLGFNSNQQSDKEVNNKYKWAQFLKYPLKQIAQIHYQADGLSVFDLTNKYYRLIQLLRKNSINKQDLSSSQYQEMEMLKENFKQYKKQVQSMQKQTCPCCLLIITRQRIPFCTPIDEVNNIGMSIMIFFKDLWFISYLMLAMLIVLSAPSLLFNLITSLKIFMFGHENGLINQINKQFYIGSLRNFQKYDFIVHNNFKYLDVILIVETGLAIILILIWQLMLFYFRKIKIRFQQKIDQNTITAADYTLVFQDMPPQIYINGKLTNQYSFELQRQLNQIRKSKLQQTGCPYRTRYLGQQKIKIQSIIFQSRAKISFQQLESSYNKKLKKQLQHKKSQLIRGFKQFQENGNDNSQILFYQYSSKRLDLINGYINRYNQQYEKKDILTKQRKNLDIYVVFGSTKNKQFVESLQNVELSYRASLQDQNQKKLHKVKQAPQPQDINWTSVIDRQQRGLRVFLAIVVSIVILIVSLFINWVFESNIQEFANFQNKKIYSYILTVIKNLVIFLFNQLILYILGVFTKYEEQLTHHHQLNSMGIKSTFFLVINTTFVPLAVHYYFIVIHKEVNETKTLELLANNILSSAIIAFFSSFTPLVHIGALIRPIFRLINRVQQNNFWQFLYRKHSWRNLAVTQVKYNMEHQKYQFDVGAKYAQIINYFLFACFFASLQPIIIPIFLLYFVAKYHMQKIVLYKQSKRPIPGQSQSNKIIFFIISFGPLLYVIGWSYFTIFHKKQTLFTALWITLAVLSILSIIIRIYYLVKKQFAPVQSIRVSSYQRDKPLFTKQYEQTYPLISQKKKLQYKKASQQKKKASIQKSMKNENQTEVQIFNIQLAIKNKVLKGQYLMQKNMNLENYGVTMQQIIEKSEYPIQIESFIVVNNAPTESKLSIPSKIVSSRLFQQKKKFIRTRYGF